MTILKQFFGLRSALVLAGAVLSFAPAYGQTNGAPVVFSSTGAVMNVGGTGEAGFSGDGGQAAQAQFSAPAGAAADPAGNVYIVDRGNGRVRRIDPDGEVRTVAGGADDGQVDPADVAVGSDGMVHIADPSQHAVLTLDESGGSSDMPGVGGEDSGSADDPGAPSILVTTAGDGTPGFSGDGGPATAAQLNSPSGLAVDRMGNLFIADTMNNRIRKVDTAGVITTVAGNGEAGSDGVGGPAVDAQLNSPQGIAADIAGNLFIADTMNHRILRVDAETGAITIVAGTGEAGYSGDDGSAARAQLSSPQDVAVDVLGNLYIADTANGRVRKVDTAGMITTVLMSDSPTGIALTPNGLYVTDSSSHSIRSLSASLQTELTMYAQPEMLNFMVNQDAEVAAQQIVLAAVRGQAANLSVVADRSWISVSPSSADLALGEWAPVTVTVNPNELAEGSHSGLLSVMLGNRVVARVAVMVEVLPPVGPAVSVNEGVVNAARMSIYRQWLFGRQLLPLAPGSRITLRGANFIEGEQPIEAAAFPLPTTLGGVRVKLNGMEAPLRMVGPQSIQAQVPWGVVMNPRSLPWVRAVVETPAGESYPRRFLVAPFAPGVFTLSGSGTGQAMALFGDTMVPAAPRGAVLESRPASAGDLLTIYATGLGAVNPPLGDGMNSCMPDGLCLPDGSNAVLRHTVERPRVWIGGMEVPAENILFSGMAPHMAATNVVVVNVPAGIAPSNAAPLVVLIGGRTTQAGVTIAVE